MISKKHKRIWKLQLLSLKEHGGLRRSKKSAVIARYTPGWVVW